MEDSLAKVTQEIEEMLNCLEGSVYDETVPFEQLKPAQDARHPFTSPNFTFSNLLDHMKESLGKLQGTIEGMHTACLAFKHTLSTLNAKYTEVHHAAFNIKSTPEGVFTVEVEIFAYVDTFSDKYHITYEVSQHKDEDGKLVAHIDLASASINCRVE